MREIKDRMQAEEQIKASLTEKEILLRELHHRVKNNLAVVISLLNLQANQIKEDRIAEALKESRDRVMSIALIHETLYRSERLSEVKLIDYVKNLSNRLAKAMKAKGTQVRIIYEIEEICLTIDQAIPCGLILNELLTNALKYSPRNGQCQILIKAYTTALKEIELIVHDNGKGFPAGFKFSDIKSLGLRIVSDIIGNQLEGVVEARNENGARITVRWPADINK